MTVFARPAICRQALLAIVITIILGGLPGTISADEVVGDPPETVPVEEPGSLYDYELTVVNVATNPFELLDAYSPGLTVNSNQSIIMIQIEATYTGDSMGTPDGDFWYEITDRDGYDHLHGESSCEVWPLSPDSVRIASGETARFNLCFLVPSRPVATAELELVVGTNLITERWPAPFSLDLPDGSEDEHCACGPPTLPPLTTPSSDALVWSRHLGRSPLQSFSATMVH